MLAISLFKYTFTGTPEAAFNLKDCQEKLFGFYRNEMKVQLLPWDPAHTTDMDTIFVNLELMKEEVNPAVTKHIQIDRNEDLVTFQKSDGKRVNRVFIQGDAGSGKSTLLSNVAYKWAKQDSESPLMQFTLVFMIGVHEIDKEGNLVDAIFDQILEEDSVVSREGLTTYIKSHPKEVLYLIDGLDEDNSGVLANDSTEVTQVLGNKKLKESCVIVTS